MAKFRSNADELLDRLRSEGKVTTLPSAEIQGMGRDTVHANLRLTPEERLEKKVKALEKLVRELTERVESLEETRYHEENYRMEMLERGYGN